MKLQINKIVVSLFLTFAAVSQSQASSECYGQTRDGKEITVRTYTRDIKGTPEEGEVRIEDQGHHYGYRFSKADFVQYYEHEETGDQSAFIGMKVFVDASSPIELQYLGVNHTDMDLRTIYQQLPAATPKGNFLRVWRGPGHEASNQYQMTRIVCSTWVD
jgi:hypothetical protein